MLLGVKVLLVRSVLIINIFLTLFSPAREELKRREEMLRKLKALSSSMLKLANRRKRWTIRWEMLNLVVLVLDVVLDLVLVKNFEDRIGKVEEEWGEAAKERRRMRVELQNLIRSKKFKSWSNCLRRRGSPLTVGYCNR